MIKQSNKTRTIAKNTGFLYVRMILVALVGLYTSRVVLQVLGVEDFGTYNLVASLVVMFLFLKMALTNATYRFLAYDLGAGVEDNLKKTFSMSINIHVLLTIVIIILSECIGPWYIGNMMKIDPSRIYAAQVLFQLSLLGFAIDTIMVPYNSLIVAHEYMNFYALTSIVEVILKLLIVFLLPIAPFDKLIFYGFLTVCVRFIIFIWMAIYDKLHFSECQYVKGWNSTLFKKLVNYSGLSLIVNMIDIAVVQSIGIFFNMFYGLVANAAYGIANQVNGVLQNFVNNFSQSYNPQIIKSYAAKQFEYFHKLIHTASKISFLMYFCVAFPILLNINFILKIWLVDPPLLTDQFLYCIVVLSIFDALGAPMWNSVYATGKIKTHQLLMGGIKILNIPLSYFLLINNAPIVWVLVVYASLNGVCWFVRTIYLKTLINFDVKLYFRDVILKSLITVLVSVVPTLFLCSFIQNGIAKLVVSILFFEVIFLLAGYNIGLNYREKELVLSLVKGALNKLFGRAR